ncbi:MAG: hypothetical protein O3A87_07320 [Verrucomicrobia bacterium]|nr:hypothetical protein [Verrucomicrobiota bacterium]MDA1006277.1 hypothetical protein [Verrucomicrobiota bacterium]
MNDYNRREFIRTSLPGFLGLTMALPAITALATRANACQGRPAPGGTINWDAFLEAVAKEAAKQHLDHWNETDYLQCAAALAHTLNLQDPALAAAFEHTKTGLGNERIDFYDLEKRRDFQINLLQFEQGERLRHHDHPGMTGVLLCTTGRLQTDNYDLLERRESGSFLLRQSASEILEKGTVSTLTSHERNIHRVEALDLCQVIDIFAPPYDPQRSAKSTFFNVDPEPFKGKQGLFEATLA